MEDKRILLNNNIAIQAINNNKIYIYTVTDLNGKKTNKGWLKVGQTIRLTDDRAKETTRTDGLTADILYDVSAQDINGNPFTDHEIHNILVKKGFTRKLEWFSINYYKQDRLFDEIKNIIEDRINCRGDFSQLKGKPTAFKLRPNQDRAVEKTYARWEVAQKLNDSTSSSVKQFLWNAKPRFGKTLTAYEFAKRIHAKKILIVTQRTAISDSWHQDYYKWIRNSTNYKFGSSKQNQLKQDGHVIHTALSKSESRQLAANVNEDLIFYISFADIKGHNAHEFKESNKWIFDTPWDLFIIDETHEGSGTDKAINVFDNLRTEFTLHLSGTPFKKLASEDFNDKNTYTWSYADEQERKNSWDYTDGENPYAEMPKLSIYTYQLSPELRRVCQSEEYSFDFAEFFKNDGNTFVHEAEIIQFLDNLSAQHETSDENTQYFPFADSRTRNQLRHTFWLLPMKGGVKMCELLKKLLKSHHYFTDYDVIMAAGDGDKDRAKSDKAIQEVRAKAGAEPWKTKTITLSCGQLTTGVTVEPWTAVLMLNNLSSPEQYLQAAFRAQNPWRYQVNGEIYNKTDCYVFDFAPDRILKIIDEYANADVVRRDGPTRKQNIKKLINHMSVLALDKSGQMRYLDAADVLELPHYYDAQDIVDNSFMSNKLFNIGNIFSLLKEKREQAEGILNQMNPVKNKKVRKNQPEVGTESPELPENITISESPLGERQYEIETTNENGETETVVITSTELSGEDDLPTAGDPAKNEQLQAAIAEINKEKGKVKTEEEKQRDRLRGFSRTIPMFLMAYGKNTTTLANFDEFVNAQVFEELAGITRDQFRVLRDDCQFFNEPRFNAAIKEFLERKSKLADYYKSDTSEDIFNIIPPQDTNQIFTPKKVVNMQLDALEESDPLIFKNPHNTFFDPQMKSGQYITEIAKRLYRHSKDKDIKRILTTQLYGLAPTKILTDITHEYIFGFVDFKDKKKYQRNFVHMNLLAEDVRGKVIIKQDDGLQNVVRELWGNDMKFTAVVGNPPYQDGNDQIYASFAKSSVELADLVSLIFPLGWQKPTNVNGLSAINTQDFKQSGHLVKVDNYYENNTSPIKLFTGVSTGGVNIILWDKNHRTPDSLTPIYEYGQLVGKKKLPITKEDLEKPDEIMSIWAKVGPLSESMADKGSASKPYGFRADPLSDPAKYGLDLMDEKQNNDDLKLYGLISRSRTYKYIKRNQSLKISPLTDEWKLFIPKAWGNMDEKAGYLGGSYGQIFVGEPGDICSETYIEFGPFANRLETSNAEKYFKSKFFRAVFYVNKVSQNTARDTFKSVPLQNFTATSDIDWSKSIPEIDQQLYHKYNLSDSEIAFIESRVKAME